VPSFRLTHNKSPVLGGLGRVSIILHYFYSQKGCFVIKYSHANYTGLNGIINHPCFEFSCDRRGTVGIRDQETLVSEKNWTAFVRTGILRAGLHDTFAARRTVSEGSAMNDTYRPQAIDTSHVTLPPELVPLLERLAENAHEVWSKGRMDDGWTFGPQRDDVSKQHPCLVPYDQLPESEKDYDRRISQETLKAILALNYEIHFRKAP
jgi:hypothetical protein